jgi:hypothetical protein
MPATFGFEAVSVDAHRRAGEGFLDCEIANDDTRTFEVEDERKERMQPRAAL